MSLVRDSLIKIAPYLGWWIAIFTIIGLALAGFLAYIIARSFTKAKEEKDPESIEKTRFFGMLNEDFRYGERIPPRGTIGTALALRGVFKSGEFSLAFLRAMEFLRRQLGGRGAEYVFPWYLMIGPTGGGKTSLLERCGLNLPVGRPDFEGHGDHSNCKWWFFDRSVVLDIHGSFVLHQTGLTSNENRWQLLLLLLERYRGKRPLDGVILTIPADELWGEGKLDHNELLGRAKQLAEKLAQAQDTLGMRVPVYMVITKCDLIPGFKDFAELIPTDCRQQMMGWSSPYGITAPFEPAWIDRAFEEIDLALDRLVVEIFAGDTEEKRRDEAFLFPEAFQELKDGIHIYANNIFKFSTYRDPFVLRGIYFCGEGDPLPEVVASQEFTPFPQMSAATQETYHGTAAAPLYFIRDTLTAKIFREYSLSQPVPARQKADYRSTMMLRASVIAILGLFTLGSAHDYHRLVRLREELLPVLYQMQQILMEEKDQDADPSNKGLNDTIAAQTQILLRLMGKIHSTGFFSLFLPPSWFSNLHDMTGKTLAIGYEQIIAQSVQDQFVKQFHRIIEGKLATKGADEVSAPAAPTLGKAPPSSAQDSLKNMSAKVVAGLVSKGEKKSFDPLRIDEFKDLERYVSQIIEFEKHIEKFNTLVNSADQSKLSEVTEYLFGFALPRESLNYLRKFKGSKHYSGHRSIEISGYQVEVRRQFKKKYQRYLNAVLEVGPNYEVLTTLADELKKFSGEARETLTNLQLADLYRNITKSIGDAVDFINSPALDWIEGNVFNPGDGYTSLMLQVAENSSLLGSDAAQSMMKEAAGLFDTFKKQLLLMSTPISGPFFLVSNGQVFSQPSETLASLKGVLSEFFSQPFMAIVDEGSFETLFSHEKRIMWDTNALSRAVLMAQNFSNFLVERLAKYPKELQETLKIMGTEHTLRHVNYQLKQAQNFITPSQNAGLPGLEEELRTIIPNFKAASPFLLKLLETLSNSTVADTFVRLRDLVVSEATQLLQTVDHMLDAEKTYAISGGNFEWWDGKEGAAYKAFAAKDITDLKAYLDVQRDRIALLARDFAQPVVVFLQHELLKTADHHLTLLSKWSRIMAQLDSYAKKKPDNTIVGFETFVQVDLNQLNYGVCFERIKESQLNAHTGDYFEERRIEIMKQAYDKCLKTSFDTTLEFYKNLSDQFNTKLAGKFPFVPVEAIKQTGDNFQEADPQDLKDFLVLASQVTPLMRYAIDHDKRFEASRTRVKNFLRKVDELLVLFQPFVSGAPGQDAPLLKITPEFRVNQEQEVAANQIIDFDMEFGEGQVITLADNGKAAAWKYGSPITFTLKWAEGGSSLPGSDPKQPNLSTHGYVANFYFKNQWALFNALFSHAATQGDFSATSDTTPHVLKFELPVTQNNPNNAQFPTSTQSNKTRVFIRLRVAVPVPGGEKQVRITSLPVFAPPLEAQAVAGMTDKSGNVPDGDKKDDNDDLNLNLGDGAKDDDNDKGGDDQKADQDGDDDKEGDGSEDGSDGKGDDGDSN